MSPGFLNARLAAFGGGQTRTEAEGQLKPGTVIKAKEIPDGLLVTKDLKHRPETVGEGIASSVEPRKTGGHPRLQALSFAAKPEPADLLLTLQEGDFTQVLKAVIDYEQKVGPDGLGEALVTLKETAEYMRLGMISLELAIDDESLNHALGVSRLSPLRSKPGSAGFDAKVDAATELARARVKQLQPVLRNLAALPTSGDPDGPASDLMNLLQEGNCEAVIELTSQMAVAVGSAGNLPVSLRLSYEIAGAMQSLLDGLDNASTEAEVSSILRRYEPLRSWPIMQGAFQDRLRVAMRGAADRINPPEHRSANEPTDVAKKRLHMTGAQGTLKRETKGAIKAGDFQRAAQLLDAEEQRVGGKGHLPSSLAHLKNLTDLLINNLAGIDETDNPRALDEFVELTARVVAEDPELLNAFAGLQKQAVKSARRRLMVN